MGYGTNADGKFVSFLHKCLGCKAPLPLPDFADLYCPHCGAVPFNKMVAQANGQRVEDTPVCDTCETVQDGKFCTKCGNPITTPKASIREVTRVPRLPEKS